MGLSLFIRKRKSAWRRKIRTEITRTPDTIVRIHYAWRNSSISFPNSPYQIIPFSFSEISENFCALTFKIRLANFDESMVKTEP